MNPRFVNSLFNENGALRAGDVRYVLVRADGLMNCFKSDAQSATLAMYQVIENSFCEFGGKSTQLYASEVGADTGLLLSKVEEMAPQLGWGEWTFSLDLNEKRLGLRVYNSPFSEGYGPAGFAVCAPVCGMLKGVAERLFSQSVSCEEVHCSAMGGDACEFLAIADAA